MECLPDTSTILEAEEEASSAIGKSFLDVAIPFDSGSSSSIEKKEIDSRRENSKNPAKTTNYNMIAAALFLLLSVLVGFILTVKRP